MVLLISFEGIDGSGKTTLIKNLKNKINFDLLVHSWRDTDLGQKVWNLLNETRAKSKNDLPSTWSYILLFFVAFDELNQKIIQPNLTKKVIVIDRYIDSTFVYQGLMGNIGVNTIQEVAQKTINIPLPDITFLLDIDPLQARKRLKKRKLETGENTNWDNLNLEFHQKVRSRYLELKKYFPERVYIIDASKSENEIAEEVSEIIQQVISPKGDLPKFVRVIIQNQKGEILLVKDKKWGWNLPGGRVETDDKSPEVAAKREVFEETNLVLENCEELGKQNTFFANLEKENQVWEGYYYQSNKYSGEIKIKEPEKILDIKFIDVNSSPEAGEFRGSWKFYLDKVAKMANKPSSLKEVKDIEEINKNSLIIIAGGSGTGKSTAEKLLSQDPHIVKLISTTTRPKREGEENGKDYYFISKEEFETELTKGRFLEHVVYDGNYYGIHGKVVDLILGTQKKNGVIIVDVEGFRQLKKYCAKKDYTTISFWFQAESLEKMVEHMQKRGTSEPEIIRRLIIEEQERKAISEFDFVLTIPENGLQAVVQKIKSEL